MVKTQNFVEGDSTLATKAIWDDELTLIYCELCMNEVNASSIGWCPSKKMVNATKESWAEKYS
ncbi:hypothetical protein Gotur_018633 [Gossypium turneri]